MSLKLERSSPPEWLSGIPCANQVCVPVRSILIYLNFFIPQVSVRLEGEAGLGVSVPVSLLVADSRLASAELSGHEADQAG